MSESSPSADYTRRLLVSTCLAIIGALAGGFGVGFATGMKFEQERQRQNQVKKSKPYAYTVLDAERVIEEDGDTVAYRWNRIHSK
jgi:hypothetical protein